MTYGLCTDEQFGKVNNSNIKFTKNRFKVNYIL